MKVTSVFVFQFLNYQKNNKTIIYRMLDVANQVDWVRERCSRRRTVCRFSSTVSLFLRCSKRRTVCRFSSTVSLFLRCRRRRTVCRFSSTVSLFLRCSRRRTVCRFSSTVSLFLRCRRRRTVCRFSSTVSLFLRCSRRRTVRCFSSTVSLFLRCSRRRTVCRFSSTVSLFLRCRRRRTKKNRVSFQFYRPLNVRVALTGLEIWSDRDKIRVEKSPTETLNHFLEWRTRELLPRLRHDNAQLVMGGSFDGTTVGMASQSSMCSRDRSGGVNVDHLVSVLGVASTVAHELGHNLGMSHDTAERRCSCQNERRLGGCIMEPSTGFLPGQQFSSCSAADLSVSLLHGGGMCLFNVPPPDRLLGGPRCGNLYVETGEQCDCGLLEECEDLCCNASTCRLVAGAQCSSDGICCHDCKLRAAGSVCRDSLGECDLPEFCTGSSPYCPPNVFLQNGELCEDDASYCYEGVCASMHTQCQMLWGPNATRAPAVCFSSVNKQGNKYGNCGQLTNGSYIPCGNSDVHCGRIQCRGGRERPLLGTNAEILTTKVRFNHSDLVCRGTFFHLGDDVSDPATVAQGTACSAGKACLNQKCQDASVFGVEDCHRKCNGHGVCNSNQNCHCEVGWAPPDCRYSGHGGITLSSPCHPSVLTLSSLCPHPVITLSSPFHLSVLTLSSLCPHPFISLSSPCHHPVLTLSSPCPHPVIPLSSPCHLSVLTLSSPCHHPVITLSSPCHHPVITLSSPCHPPVLTLSSPCPHPVIPLSSPCHHPVIPLSSPCHPPVLTLSSLCPHPVITLSSLCPHPVIPLSSPCHHPVIPLSSPCHPPVLTLSSLCPHPVLTLSSPCPHPVIPLSYL
uniref:ADAM metallopeptidase domain 15 n=1 Tax=Cyclopterus lumpus TaxID=8103 RepID=A0A8C2WZQ3_CYCLU